MAETQRHDLVRGYADSAPSVAVCPKCGSGRIEVTVRVSEGADHLDLYRCGVCSHRFSRAARRRT